MFQRFAFLDWALFLAMGMTGIVLVIGLYGMVKGGSFNEKNSNKLMRWRVILQGIALALFALVLVSKA